MEEEDISKHLEIDDPDSDNDEQFITEVHHKRVYNNLASKMIRRKLNRESFMRSNMGKMIEKALDSNIQFIRRKSSQTRSSFTLARKTQPQNLKPSLCISQSPKKSFHDSAIEIDPLISGIRPPLQASLLKSSVVSRNSKVLKISNLRLKNHSNSLSQNVRISSSVNTSLAPQSVNDRFKFLNILKRSESSKQVPPRLLSKLLSASRKEMVQTHQENLCDAKQLESTFSRCIRSPALAEYNSVKYTQPRNLIKPSKLLSHQKIDVQNVIAGKAGFSKNHTEKEIGITNAYYYRFKKSFEINPFSTTIISYIKKVFNETFSRISRPDLGLQTKAFFYETHKRIEKNSSFKIMKGKQIISGMPVAITIVKNEPMTKNLIDEQEFQLEVHRKCQDNPYLVKIYESFRDSQQYYLVSEFGTWISIENMDSKKRANLQGFMPKFFYEILHCIKQIHRAQIVHGNINPKSIYIEENGQPRLQSFSMRNNRVVEACMTNTIKRMQRPRHGQLILQQHIDFENEFSFNLGASNDLKRKAKFTYQVDAHQFSESVKYYQFTAPELHEKEKKGCSKKIDVWSIGVLFFFICYRKLPFKGENISAIRQEIASNSIDFPMNSSSGFINLHELIKIMLKKDPTQRASITEVMNHRWFEEVKAKFAPAVSRSSHTDRAKKIKNDLTLFMQEIGIPGSYLNDQISANNSNHVRACFEALVQQSYH